MNQVNQFGDGVSKEANVYEMDGGLFLVEYSNTEVGHFLRAGFFSTKELADAKAVELLGAECITGEMLAGDVAA